MSAHKHTDRQTGANELPQLSTLHSELDGFPTCKEQQAVSHPKTEAGEDAF